MKILFFDGFCTICNGFVDWGLKHDQTGQIKFASLQGETAKQLIQDKSYLKSIDTVVYLREDKIFDRSDAILYFLKDTQSFFSWLWVFIYLPGIVRNCFYQLVAKNRYFFFKKRQLCRMPTALERDRLLS